jgi:hypothetical protein
MATITFGGGITNAVGSHGGTTFARNKGGSYMKSKPNGIRPQTISQRTAQTNASTASKAWTYGLTDAQRTAWASFASITPVINRLGQTTFLSGQQMYVKLNSRLQRIGSSLLTLPPSSTAIGTPGSVTFAVVSHSGPLTIGLTVGSPQSGDHAIFWMSPPMPPGRTSISSQLRLLPGTYTVNASVNVDSAYLSVFGARPSAGGQRMFVRGQVLNNSTGLTSAMVQGTAIWT